MSLRAQVGPQLGAFVRWLVAPGTLDLRDVLEVIERPSLFEAEWRQFLNETAPRPTLDELEGEERATQR